ncbi:unnamed protein product [Mortierella alpina]
MQSASDWRALDALHLGSPCIQPTLLSKVIPAAPSPSTATLLIVHSQPRLLYEILNNKLHHTWSFPQDIVTFCWNESTLTHNKNHTQSLLVATVDGIIWNISLGQSTDSKDGCKDQLSQQVTIKIEDSEEEVELWNDEDGLLEDIDKLDSLSPAPKRFRSSSPMSSLHGRSSQRGSVGEAGSKNSVTKVDESMHAVGAENNVTHMVVVSGKLLLFRRGAEPSVWSSQDQFATGCVLDRKPVSTTHPLSEIRFTFARYARQSENSLRSDILIATDSGAIYLLSESTRSDVDKGLLSIEKMTTLTEPTVALVSLPSFNDNQNQAVMAIGKLGGLTMLQELSAAQPTFAASRTLSSSIQNAFVAEAYLYALTTTGRLLRLPLAWTASGRDMEVEHLDLPSLCSFVPIHSESGCDGFYGCNFEGQVLLFSADMANHSRSQSTVLARDNIHSALQELEKLSEQAKRLEEECQLENQRIVAHNRLILELQRSVMSQRAREMPTDHFSDGSTPVIDMETATFVQSVATAGHKHRRYFMRLNISSSADIDWSSGWSAVISMTSENSICRHGITPSGLNFHNQVVTSLKGLSQHSSWSEDIEIHLHSRLRLPLKVTLGLQYNESEGLPRQPSEPRRKTLAYFEVETLDLDAVHFAEPIPDAAGRALPKSHIHTMGFSRTLHSEDTTPTFKDSFRQLFWPAAPESLKHLLDCDGCMQDNHMAVGTSRTLSLPPLEFELNTDEIQIEQVLPALLGDGRLLQEQKQPLHRSITALVQSAFRAGLFIPDACLPSRFTDLDVNTDPGLKTTALDRTRAMTEQESNVVWISMETTMEATGTTARAHIQIRGSDPIRTRVVHHALANRAALLF